MELEQRIARLELKLQHAADQLDHTRHRVTSLQAQIDHLIARLAERV